MKKKENRMASKSRGVAGKTEWGKYLVDFITENELSSTSVYQSHKLADFYKSPEEFEGYTQTHAKLIERGGRRV
jgi:hypothetical protein